MKSLVGTVIDGCSDLVGQRVHVLHPHQRFATVRVEDVFLLPPALDSRSATLISNMETAVNAVWDAHPAIGDSVLIQGFGVIGALLAKLIDQIPGISLTIVETDPDRINHASSAGFAVCQSTEDLGGKIDIAFNTAASEGSLQRAIDSTRFEGLTVELSWYGSRPTQVQLGGGFHYDRKRVIASQVSSIPASKQAFWSYQRRKNLVSELLMSMNTNDILTHHISFEKTSTFFNRLRDQPHPDPGVVITY